MTTDPRADEVLHDRILRYGGKPYGEDVIDEWSLRGAGSQRLCHLSRQSWQFCSGILETPRKSIAIAVLDLMSQEPFVQAAFVSTAGACRDFIASGFPVAGMSAKTHRVRLFVGFDSRPGRQPMAVSTVGEATMAELSDHQLIALSGNVGWYTSN